MTPLKRVAIVTDSTSDLPPDLRESLGITMVPLNVHFGDTAFREEIDITTEAFVKRLNTTEESPTTSQPSTELFEQTFQALAQDHEEVVCVLLSSRLSGTVESAQRAAFAVQDTIRVEIVDSLNASLGCGYQVLNAVGLAGQGLDAATIAATLRGQQHRYHVIFIVETLDHMRRGGRIGKAATLLGSLLQLKPILRMDEGVVVPFERSRTRRKAIDELAAFAENLASIERITALHNTTPEDAEDLISRVGHLAQGDSMFRAIVSGPVLGTHVGTGTLGLAIEVSPNG